MDPAAQASRERTLAVLLAICSTLAAFFAMVNLRRSLDTLVLAELGLAAAYLADLAYLLRYRRFRRAALLAVATTVVVVLYAARIIGIQALYWIYAIPLLTFYLLDLSDGLILNMVLLTVYSVFLAVIPLDVHPLRYVGLDIIASYLLVVALAVLYEMQKRRHARELRRLSATDPLTGAYNRRLFHGMLAREIERCRRYGGDLTLVMLDVDNYKEVNDRHGHLRGDAVLQSLASLVRDNIRTSDRFVRYGGDEFVIVAPQTSLADAERATNKLRILIADTDFEDPVHITVSMGLAQWQAGDDADALIRRADHALYAAKQAGRNRVTHAVDATTDSDVTAGPTIAPIP